MDKNLCHYNINNCKRKTISNNKKTPQSLIHGTIQTVLFPIYSQFINHLFYLLFASSSPKHVFLGFECSNKQWYKFLTIFYRIHFFLLKLILTYLFVWFKRNKDSDKSFRLPNKKGDIQNWVSSIEEVAAFIFVDLFDLSFFLIIYFSFTDYCWWLTGS